MAIEERVSRLEGEQTGMRASLDALRADMDFRFGVVIGMLVGSLGLMVAVLMQV